MKVLRGFQAALSLSVEQVRDRVAARLEGSVFEPPIGGGRPNRALVDPQRFVQEIEYPNVFADPLRTQHAMRVLCENTFVRLGDLDVALSELPSRLGVETWTLDEGAVADLLSAIYLHCELAAQQTPQLSLDGALMQFLREPPRLSLFEVQRGQPWALKVAPLHLARLTEALEQEPPRRALFHATDEANGPVHALSTLQYSLVDGVLTDAGTSGVLARFESGGWSYTHPRLEEPLGRDGALALARSLRPWFAYPYLRLTNEASLLEAVARLREWSQTEPVNEVRALVGALQDVSNCGPGLGQRNRVTRAAPGTAEAAMLDLAKALEVRTGGWPFQLVADAFPVASRQGGRAAKDLPRKAQLSPQALQERCPGGVLFHGLKLDTALTYAFRPNYSSDAPAWGRAYHGAGEYYASSPEVAASYAGSPEDPERPGTLIARRLRADVHPRVVDLAAFRGSSLHAKLLKRAKANGESLHVILAREYGVDALVHRQSNGVDYFMVLNTAIFEGQPSASAATSTLLDAYSARDDKAKAQLGAYLRGLAPFVEPTTRERIRRLASSGARG